MFRRLNPKYDVHLNQTLSLSMILSQSYTTLIINQRGSSIYIVMLLQALLTVHLEFKLILYNLVIFLQLYQFFDVVKALIIYNNKILNQMILVLMITMQLISYTSMLFLHIHTITLVTLFNLLSVLIFIVQPSLR